MTESRLSVRELRAKLGRFSLGPIDLEVAPGEVLAIVGPSGAGKTTLLRALAGFIPSSEGSVLLEGGEVGGVPPEERGVGYVPQGLALLPHRSVLRNVRFGLDLRGRRDAEEVARSWLDRFGLGPLESVRPARLSGGEQQRVAMARALAVEPRLLLWDEPVSALDPASRAELLALLRSTLRELRSPMLLVTHDAETAFAVASRFLVLQRGKATFFGRGTELVRSPPDAFSARFAGYANVVLRSELERGPPSAFRSWLLARSGTEGVCWAAGSTPLVSAEDLTAAGSRWPLRVEGLKPHPDGWLVRGTIEGVPVSARWDPPAESGGGTSPPSSCTVTVEESALRPLGGSLSLEGPEVGSRA